VHFDVSEYAKYETGYVRESLERTYQGSEDPKN